jgi:DNA-binding NtrC family response regulator
MTGFRILLVEDNASLRRGIARALGESFGVVDQISKGDEAVERLRDRGVEPYHVVLTDLRLPGASGIDVLRAARERDTRIAVVLMTAYGSIQTAVEAMKLGAFDFVQKPFELDELEARIAKACSHARLIREVEILREERAERLGVDRIVGTSESLQTALDLARRVAPTRSTVLVTGETGTGKELIASVIHANSPRAAAPLVKVNCAALPETLLESELFGHERGAFTSADRLRIGRFEQADRGTLFLDEVGDMSPATQAKLLRVLQDQQFHRLGGTRVLRTDVRIVAATNQDLEKAIRTGEFREDLYFRLNVIGIRLAPLRERSEDLEALSRHFLAEFSRELGRPRSGFTQQALARIQAHSWPGNIRELRNVIERAVLMSDGERIEAEDIGLPESSGGESGCDWRPELPPEGVGLDQVERAVVLEALQRTRYVQKEAAQLLRISRRKLNYMIQRMGITHASWRRNRGDEDAARDGGAADPVDSSAIR